MIIKYRTLRKMIIFNTWQMLLIYGIMLLLVHISTNGFRHDAPFFSVLPLLSLVIMTFGTRMRRLQKFCTAGSFFMLAIGVYYWALLPKHIIIRALFFCGSTILYLYSFVYHVRRIWVPLVIVTSIFSTWFVYYCTGDLFRSLPTLVLSVAGDMFTLSAAIIASGSLWKYGSKGRHIYDVKHAALMRFIGLLIELFCASALLFNHFLNHHNFQHYMILLYIAQFLLFISNERTF